MKILNQYFTDKDTRINHFANIIMSSRFHREHVSLGESDNMRTLLHVTLKPLIRN